MPVNARMHLKIWLTRADGKNSGLPPLGGRGAPFRPGARAAIAQYRPGSGR